jgi:hypothetical protein
VSSASRPAVYLELLENLQVHGYHLMRERGRVLGEAEVAGDWFDHVYEPAVRAVERDRLGERYRDAPEADLFLLLHRQRREGFPSCGCPPLRETYATVAAQASSKRGLQALFRRG